MGRILNISKNKIIEISNYIGFNEGLIEKILRLEDLLKDIYRHPYLKTRLLLKGGTALNFCYFDRPRLSVDIDFNYIGSLNAKKMIKERVIVDEAITRIVEDKDYRISKEPGKEHAGGKWRLSYRNTWNTNQIIELDINYLYRMPVGLPQNITFKTLSSIDAFKISIVSKEELFAGKIVACLSRVAARDLFDVANIVKYKDYYNKNFLRKIVILFGAAQREDFREITVEKINRISDNEINNSLSQLLPQNVSVEREKLFQKIIPFLEDILNFRASEKEFLDRYLDQADYRPEILFSEYPNLISNLEKHPVLLWKVLNIKKYLNK